jgi:hypothetical protein
MNDEIYFEWLMCAGCSIPTTVMILIGFGLCMKHGARLPRSTRLLYIGLSIGAVFSSGAWIVISLLRAVEYHVPEMTTDYFAATFVQQLPGELLRAILSAIVAYAALVPEPTPLDAVEGGGDVG